MAEATIVAAPATAVPSGVIPVQAAPIQVAAPAAPSAPAKPGSAKARMQEAITGISVPSNSPMPRPGDKAAQKAAAATTPPAAPADPADPEAPTDPNTSADPAEPVTAADPSKPGDTAKSSDKKVSPWKLVDEHKAARLKAETELAELRKLVPNEVEAKKNQERLAQIEKRNQELEEHIKFVDYTKSSEFVDKYQKPYEQQWQKSMSELSEINITDIATGEERPVKPSDLLELVNAPLGKAREIANEKFGDFADDVMAHRKEIRGLYEKQAAALEEARKGGEERSRITSDQQREFQQKLTKAVSDEWSKANQEFVNHEKVGQFFKPVEGNDAINASLEKGFAFVDEAFKQNPMDPKLTSEQRAKIIRAHAAVRNRAAAFGRLVIELNAERAARKADREQLDQYKASTPGGVAAPVAPSSAQASSSKRQQMADALMKIARPA